MNTTVDLSRLNYFVQCRWPAKDGRPGWETMCGWDGLEVATEYAKNCNSKKVDPAFAYRVVNRKGFPLWCSTDVHNRQRYHHAN